MRTESFEVLFAFEFEIPARSRGENTFWPRHFKSCKDTSHLIASSFCRRQIRNFSGDQGTLAKSFFLDTSHTLPEYVKLTSHLLRRAQKDAHRVPLSLSLFPSVSLSFLLPRVLRTHFVAFSTENHTRSLAGHRGSASRRQPLTLEVVRMTAEDPCLIQ